MNKLPVRLLVLQAAAAAAACAVRILDETLVYIHCLSCKQQQQQQQHRQFVFEGFSVLLLKPSSTETASPAGSSSSNYML
jgi:hypothetical protein